MRCCVVPVCDLAAEHDPEDSLLRVREALAPVRGLTHRAHTVLVIKYTGNATTFLLMIPGLQSAIVAKGGVMNVGKIKSSLLQLWAFVTRGG